METLEALKQIGFVQNPNGEDLLYDFGNLTLSAMNLMNRFFVEVVVVSGVFNDRRTISEVEIQLLINVDSIIQASALIAWGIDKQVSKNFTPEIPTQWLDEGRENFDLLPFVRQQKLYDERPRCTVNRDWLRLAFRDLNLLILQLEENDLLFITFQNEIFSIRSNFKTIAFPAVGKDWNEEYKIAVSNFSHFPRRINQKEVEISVWKENIQIANWRYPLINSTQELFGI